MSDTPRKDASVGYGCPPRHSQFKKGAPSPNPKGRPPKDRTRDAMLDRALNRKVTVNLPDGRREKMPMLEVSINKLVAKAATGDLRSQSLLHKIMSDQEKKSSKTNVTEKTISKYNLVNSKERPEEIVHFISNLRSIKRDGLYNLDERGKLSLNQFSDCLSRLLSGINGQFSSLAEYSKARNELVNLLDDHAHKRLVKQNRRTDQPDFSAENMLGRGPVFK